jgi:predicted nucleic acid-binding protein
LKAVSDIVDDVLPVDRAALIRASEIMQNRAAQSARDRLHVAFMEPHGIRSVRSQIAESI